MHRYCWKNLPRVFNVYKGPQQTSVSQPGGAVESVCLQQTPQDVEKPDEYAERSGSHNSHHSYEIPHQSGDGFHLQHYLTSLGLGTSFIVGLKLSKCYLDHELHHRERRSIIDELKNSRHDFLNQHSSESLQFAIKSHQQPRCPASYKSSSQQQSSKVKAKGEESSCHFQNMRRTKTFDVRSVFPGELRNLHETNIIGKVLDSNSIGKCVGNPIEPAKDKEFSRSSANKQHKPKENNHDRLTAKIARISEELVSVTRKQTAMEFNARGLRELQRGNAQKAVDWLQQSAELSHPAAQYNLGLCYENGIGLDQDTSMARKLYVAAADQGHSQASLRLDHLRSDSTESLPSTVLNDSSFSQSSLLSGSFGQPVYRQKSDIAPGV